MTTLLEMAALGAARALEIIGHYCPNVYHLKIEHPGVSYEAGQELATKAAEEVDTLFGIDVRRAVEGFINFNTLSLYSYEQKVNEIAERLRKETDHVQ